MSTYTYTESSRRYYTEAPKIIQSRGSSSDSHSSYDSKNSTASKYHSSSKSSMGYYGGSNSKVERPVEKIIYRAPDAGTYISIVHTHRISTNKVHSADEKRVESTRRGNVEVIHQSKRIYDPAAPLSSDATSSHYRKERREEVRHSSHKHSSSHRR